MPCFVIVLENTQSIPCGQCLACHNPASQIFVYFLLGISISSPQAAIKDQQETEAAAKEAEAEVEAAKAALKEATDKLQAVAADASAQLKDVAQVGFKSRLAGWEESQEDLQPGAQVILFSNKTL